MTAIQRAGSGLFRLQWCLVAALLPVAACSSGLSDHFPDPGFSALAQVSAAPAASSVEASLDQLMPQPAQLRRKAPAKQHWLTVPRQLSYQVQGPALAPALPAIELLQQFRPLLQLSAQHEAVLQISYRQFIALPALGDDESYQLEIKAAEHAPTTKTQPAEGQPAEAATDNTPAQIVLNATSSTGVLYGLMTLAQLLQCADHAPVCRLPAVHISDQPRFGWRGLLLDSARRFIPLADIRRTLDGMAAAKLNVLHWHLTDDQAWRLASAAYPQLQQQAAPGGHYRQQDVHALVQYAARRGIRLVPELDVPGHAWAIGQAYPELLAWPDGEPVRPLPAQQAFGVFPAVLDPANPAVWQFLQTLIAEWTALFPDAYLHIGGDEVKPDHWLASSAVRSYMAQHQLADAPALQAFFNQQLAALLKKAGRHMVGWDEILHPALPKDTVVQSWQGQDALGAAVRAGHPALLSAGFYLDMPQSAAYHWRNDPLAVTRPLPAVPVDARPLQLALTLQRLNGKALTGQLRLYQQAGNTWQASLAFDGRGAVPVQVQVQPLQVQGEAAQLLLSADTFLGPLALQIPLAALHELRPAAPRDVLAPMPALQALIGNHHYPLQLRPVAYQPLPAQAPLTTQEQQRLWGGEAALWTELASADVLDMKLWPRLFVVAERLWSMADTLQQDRLVSQFNRRLAALDHYSQQIGMQHRQQQQQLLRRFSPDQQMQRGLLLFSQYLQPLHYYGRHHLKTAAGRYHLAEPLDQLADALLLEPPALLTLSQDFAAAPACQLPPSWPAQQAMFMQLADLLTGYQGKQADEINHLLAQQQQLVQLLAQWPAANTASAQARLHQQLSQLLPQLQQPAGEQVLALAGITVQWLQRCAQQRAGVTAAPARYTQPVDAVDAADRE